MSSNNDNNKETNLDPEHVRRVEAVERPIEHLLDSQSSLPPMARSRSEEDIPNIPSARRKKDDQAAAGIIRTAVLATGRWQPPHLGHVFLIDEAYRTAQRVFGHAFVFVCGMPRPKPPRKLTADEKNSNPLDINQKIKYI